MPAPAWIAPDAVLDDGRADRDRDVAVAGGVEVPDGAAVDPAAARLERRRSAPWRGSSGAPVSVPAGKAGGERVGRASARAASAPAHLRHEVLHVRELLDRGVPRHLDAADLADTPEVVAREVDEHHVLGALLRIGEERLRQPRVLLGRRRRAATVPAIGRVSTSPPRQRTSISGEEPSTRRLARLQVVEIRRGIERAQGAVHVEGIDAEARRPALREDALVDLAGRDGLLDDADRLEETLPRRLLREDGRRLFGGGRAAAGPASRAKTSASSAVEARRSRARPPRPRRPGPARRASSAGAAAGADDRTRRRRRRGGTARPGSRPRAGGGRGSSSKRRTAS